MNAATMQRRHWNYRVLEFTNEHGAWYAIHEVHYEAGKPVTYTESPTDLLWDHAGGIDVGFDMLALMQGAFAKPVLREADFPRNAATLRVAEDRV